MLRLTNGRMNRQHCIRLGLTGGMLCFVNKRVKTLLAMTELVPVHRRSTGRGPTAGWHAPSPARASGMTGCGELQRAGETVTDSNCSLEPLHELFMNFIILDSLHIVKLVDWRSNHYSVESYTIFQLWTALTDDFRHPIETSVVLSKVSIYFLSKQIFF